MRRVFFPLEAPSMSLRSIATALIQRSWVVEETIRARRVLSVLASRRMRRVRNIQSIRPPRAPLAVTASRWVRNVQGSILTVALCVALAYAYAPAVSPFVLPDYLDAHERFSGTAIIDSRRRLVGVIPGSMEPTGDFSNGHYPSEDHKTLYLETMPSGWWSVLVALEDRHIGSWRSWGGIDIAALGIAGFRCVFGDLARGSSTITTQLVRSMRHEVIDASAPLSRRIRRKLIELLHAPILWRELTAEGPERLQRWVGMHVPLAHGARGSGMGSPLYGVALTSLIVFGHPADEMTLAEQAILAAAVKRPILLAPSGDGVARDRAEQRWKNIKRRAHYGLAQAFGAEHPDVLAAVTELRATPLPSLPIPDGLERRLPANDPHRFRVLANPYRRVQYFAGAELGQSIAELLDGYGRSWRRHVSGVQLSIDESTHGEFALLIERAVARFAWQQRRKLQLSLDGSDPNAQVVVSVADANGRIVRFYSQGGGLTYSGGMHKRDARGRYRPELEDRPCASVCKAAIAVLLGEQGDRPDSLYCDEALDGNAISNPGGGGGHASCDEPGAWIPAAEVFRRSLNLPLIWRLGLIPDRVINDLMERFGLAPAPGVSPRVALVLGMVGASPRTIHGLFHHIGSALAERPSNGLPSIIDRIELLPGSGRAAARMSAIRPQPQETPQIDPAALPFVEAVLSGVLTTTGTLRRLSDWHSSANPLIGFHVAKTGTSSLASHAIRDLYVAGAIELNGEFFSYLVMVGTATPSKPLGRQMAGSNLAPIVRATLQSLGSPR